MLAVVRQGMLHPVMGPEALRGLRSTLPAHPALAGLGAQFLGGANVPDSPAEELIVFKFWCLP